MLSVLIAGMARTDNTMALDGPESKCALCTSPLLAAVSLGDISEVSLKLSLFFLFTTYQNVNVTIYIVFRPIIKFPILFQFQKLSTISIKTGGRLLHFGCNSSISMKSVFCCIFHYIYIIPGIYPYNLLIGQSFF